MNVSLEHFSQLHNVCIHQGLTHLAAPHQVKLSKYIHNFAYRSISLPEFVSLQVIPCVGLCLVRSMDIFFFPILPPTWFYDLYIRNEARRKIKCREAFQTQ